MILFRTKFINKSIIGLIRSIPFFSFTSFKVAFFISLDENLNNEENNEDQTKFLKLVKDITSKGFVRSNYKKKLVDLSDIRINLKGKK